MITREQNVSSPAARVFWDHPVRHLLARGHQVVSHDMSASTIPRRTASGAKPMTYDLTPPRRRWKARDCGAYRPRYPLYSPEDIHDGRDGTRNVLQASLDLGCRADAARYPRPLLWRPRPPSALRDRLRSGCLRQGEIEAEQVCQSSAKHGAPNPPQVVHRPRGWGCSRCFTTGRRTGRILMIGSGNNRCQLLTRRISATPSICAPRRRRGERRQHRGQRVHHHEEDHQAARLRMQEDSLAAREAVI